MVFNVTLPPAEKALVDRLLKETEEIFFVKVMTPSMVGETSNVPNYADQLEFPLDFLDELEDYEMDMSGLVVLEMFNSEKEWRVAITRSRRKPDFKERVHALGDGGWREFVVENNVRMGDFVLFQLIGIDRFRVWKQPLSEHKQPPQKWHPRQ